MFRVSFHRARQIRPFRHIQSAGLGSGASTWAVTVHRHRRSTGHYFSGAPGVAQYAAIGCATTATDHTHSSRVNANTTQQRSSQLHKRSLRRFNASNSRSWAFRNHWPTAVVDTPRYNHHYVQFTTHSHNRYNGIINNNSSMFITLSTSITATAVRFNNRCSLPPFNSNSRFNQYSSQCSSTYTIQLCFTIRCRNIYNRRTFIATYHSLSLHRLRRHITATACRPGSANTTPRHSVATPLSLSIVRAVRRSPDHTSASLTITGFLAHRRLIQHHFQATPIGSGLFASIAYARYSSVATTLIRYHSPIITALSRHAVTPFNRLRFATRQLQLSSRHYSATSSISPRHRAGTGQVSQFQPQDRAVHASLRHQSAWAQR